MFILPWLILIGLVVLYFLYKKGTVMGKVITYGVVGLILIFGAYAWIRDISEADNYLQGKNAIEAGEYQKAIDYLNKAIKLQGDTTIPSSNYDFELAKAYYFIDEYELSKRYFDRAMKTDFWLSSEPKPDTSFLQKKLESLKSPSEAFK